MTGRVVARLPMDAPLCELADMVAAITRWERARGHDIDLRIHGQQIDVVETEREEVAA